MFSPNAKIRKATTPHICTSCKCEIPVHQSYHNYAYHQYKNKRYELILCQDCNEKSVQKYRETFDAKGIIRNILCEFVNS